MDSSNFRSRREKEIFLKEIIKKLHISEPEKDIYIICIDILDDTAFESFFLKIIHQFQQNTTYNTEDLPLNLIT